MVSKLGRAFIGCSFSMLLFFGGALHAESRDECSRCALVKEALEKKIGIPCGQFTTTQLGNIDELNIEAYDENSGDYGDIFRDCRASDFDGLPGLRKLSLRQLWHSDPIPNGFFANLPKLQSLKIDPGYVGMSPPDAGALNGLSELVSLTIWELPTVPQNFLSPVSKTLTYLELGSDTVPQDLLDSMDSLQTITIGASAHAMTTLSENFFVPAANLSTLTLGAVSLPAAGFAGLDKLKTLDNVVVDSAPQPFFSGKNNGGPEVAEREILERLCRIIRRHASDYKFTHFPGTNDVVASGDCKR